MKGWRAAAGLLLPATAGLLIGAAVFERFIGVSADPGLPDFVSLRRLPSRDDALICPKSLCLRAQPDLEPPIFTESALRLREKLEAYARSAPLTDEISEKTTLRRLRFVQRSSIFGEPLFIDILLIPRTNDASTLAMYARGAGPASFDHASDLARLRAWLDALSD